MKKMQRIMLCILFAMAGQIVFAGCHTAHGFGDDMESAGQSIQEHSTGQ